MPMKKIHFCSILGLIVLSLFNSCTTEVLNETPYQSSRKSEDCFSFDSIRNPANWQSYSTSQQMMDACQIPEDILSNLSTPELVELCATHPMNPVYNAYDNPMTGVRYIMENFNGFKELQKRKDAAKELLDFYERIDCTNVLSEPFPITLQNVDRRKYSVSNIGFMELVLASKAVPALYETEYVGELDRISYDKYVQKIEKIDVYGIPGLKTSLMIQSQVMLQTKSIDKVQKQELEKFVESGGEQSNVKTVSEILYNE